MKKIIVMTILIIILLFSVSCDMYRDISENESQELLNNAIDEFITKGINSKRYYINIKNNDTEIRVQSNEIYVEINV